MRNERRDQSGIWAAAALGPPVRTTRPALLRGSQSRSHRPIPTETAAATATMAGLATGSPRAAMKPITPKAAKPIAPSSNRRRARTPRPAPINRPTATTKSSRASLSFVPNQETTTSLAPGGWRSIAT